MSQTPRPVYEVPIILFIFALPLLVVAAAIYFILEIIQAIIDAVREAHEDGR